MERARLGARPQAGSDMSEDPAYEKEDGASAALRVGCERSLPKRCPSFAELAEVLTFNPADGKIWLGTDRVTLIRPEVLGSIRNALIASLGMAGAKHVLMRAGYLAGERDARLVAKCWPEGSVVENLLAGTRLFGLLGGAKVETRHFELDAARLIFRGEFLWHQAVDDEEHIRVHGIGSEAACWLPLGYADGYASTMLGTDIVFQEVECRATGSEACRVIGMPATEWAEIQADAASSKGGGSPLEFRGKGDGRREDGTFAEFCGAPEMVGVSAAFKGACESIRRVAGTRATVLLSGESGVGKENFARMLHAWSGRFGPFVAINCAAIPEALAESELFGVERGAYTGAGAARQGKFEAANGGTIFLDEISALGLACQGKLLRVLQESVVERLGGTNPIELNLRVVAACNVSLHGEVKRGVFREDLFYRLNVYPVEVPPLRSRAEDIPLLMEHFLKRYAVLYGREIGGFTQRAVRFLLNYAYPGNVRELQNLVERAVIAAEGEAQIDLRHLNMGEVATDVHVYSVDAAGRLRGGRAVFDGLDSQRESLLDSMLEMRLMIGDGKGDWFDELQNRLVAEALKRCGGNMTAAARLLGLTRSQVVYRAHRM